MITSPYDRAKEAVRVLFDCPLEDEVDKLADLRDIRNDIDTYIEIIEKSILRSGQDVGAIR